MSTESVLIVGAGPAGLALALTLLRNGVTPRIIDKNDAHRVGQKGSGLQPRTIEIFKFLGILPDIMKSSIYPGQIHRYPSPEDGNPPNVATIEMIEDTPYYPYLNSRLLGQDKLEEILRSRMKDEYNVSVELSTELVSFSQEPDFVTAKILKRSTGGETIEEVKYAYVVGTDGARSVVRKQLGLEFLGESMIDEGAVTGDIFVKGLDEPWCIWKHDQCRVVTLRAVEHDTQGRYNYMIGGTKVDLVKVASSREEIVKAIHDFTGRKDFEFGDLICSSVWRPNVRMVNKFGEGRVFVAGDAAHVHSPAGGQGTNSSVQDSFNLAWKLSLVQKGISPSSLLNSYTAERLPVIAAMLNMTTKIYREASALKAGNEEFWKRGFELKQLGVNYRGSGIVVDEKNGKIEPGEGNDPYRSGGDGTLRGGDRAPEAPGLVLVSTTGGEEISVFELFKPSYHTILLFPGSTEGCAEMLRAISPYGKALVRSYVILPSAYASTGSEAGEYQGVDGVYVDRDGYAYKHYGAEEEGGKATVFVVRPDGYVGGLVKSVKGLKGYFGGILI